MLNTFPLTGCLRFIVIKRIIQLYLCMHMLGGFGLVACGCIGIFGFCFESLHRKRNERVGSSGNSYQSFLHTHINSVLRVSNSHRKHFNFHTLPIYPSDMCRLFKTCYSYRMGKWETRIFVWNEKCNEGEKFTHRAKLVWSNKYWKFEKMSKF